MRIALISFEYPPAVAIGGIGAYAAEAARMLSAAGHDVEIFAAGQQAGSGRGREGALVHRLAVANRCDFPMALLPVFSARHAHVAFDVVESPEVGAEGLEVAAAYPDLPLVVKLHTPTYLISSLTYEPPSMGAQLRFTLGALRRGRWARLQSPVYDMVLDPEARLTRRADVVAAPSNAIASRVGSDWLLEPAQLQVFPLPYRLPETLTRLPVPATIKTIGFLGRLEPRKGVIELTQAIPRVLAACPDIRFRFLGPSWPYRHGDMQAWMQRALGHYAKAVTFVGPVSHDRLAQELALCDAMILPSRWESFGYACLESMAAGRVVIGSAAGGMADFICHGENGYLVPPHSPMAIAQLLIELASSSMSYQPLAAAGREAIGTLLAPSEVLPAQMLCYETAMRRAATRRDGSGVH